MPEQKNEKEASTYHWTMPVPPGEPVKKYAWSFDNGRMNCCASTTSSCNVSKLWQAAEPVAFHDGDLVKATKEINAILDVARRTNRDPSRELHFIRLRTGTCSPGSTLTLSDRTTTMQRSGRCCA